MYKFKYYMLCIINVYALYWVACMCIADTVTGVTGSCERGRVLYKWDILNPMSIYSFNNKKLALRHQLLFLYYQTGQSKYWIRLLSKLS